MAISVSAPRAVGMMGMLGCWATLCAPSLSFAAAPPGPLASAVAVQPMPVPRETGSYDLGLMLGGQLGHDGLNSTVSIEDLLRGLKEALGGRSPNAEEREIASRFVRDSRQALSDKNHALAQQFLEHNAKQAGIISLPSGLQYRVLSAGDSAAKSPLLTDEVTVRYRASLADGTEYDRSDQHDRAATFRVNSVFKGWQQAFLAMKPGAKWQLFVPPELGYGNNSPSMVPPGSLLIYDIELLKVEAAAAMDPAVKRGAQVVHPGTAAPGAD